MNEVREEVAQLCVTIETAESDVRQFREALRSGHRSINGAAKRVATTTTINGADVATTSKDTHSAATNNDEAINNEINLFCYEDFDDSLDFETLKVGK